MPTKTLLTRVAIDLGIVLGVVLLVGGSIIGFLWIKDAPERARMRREAETFFADINAQNKGLTALGDVNLEPQNITMAYLQERLHVPSLKKPEAHDTTRLGWACGEKDCAIWAIFHVPSDQEVPETAVPISLLLIPPPFSKANNVSVGGIHLGDSVEEIERSCKERGYGLPLSKNRIKWDADWDLVWGDSEGRIALLDFVNETMMKSVESSKKASLAESTNSVKRDAK